MENITKALIQFHKDCPAITLDSAVKYGTTNFKYASLGHILDTIKPALMQNGLMLTQTATPQGDEMITTIMHISGEQVESRVPMAQDTSTGRSGPQAQGSALTYARRYGVVTALLLVADVDDDGQTAAAAPRPAPSQNEPVKAWLNRTDKDGTMRAEWKRFIAAVAADGSKLEATEKLFRLNKTDRSLIDADITAHREGKL